MGPQCYNCCQMLACSWYSTTDRVLPAVKFSSNGIQPVDTVTAFHLTPHHLHTATVLSLFVDCIQWSPCLLYEQFTCIVSSCENNDELK